MQARVTREGEVVVVHLSGRLDVETAEPFRHACQNYLQGKKTVFDFQSVSFVGSSGILPFLETMQEFAAGNTCGVKFSGVGSEFRRVFAATPLGGVEIYDLPAQAVMAFKNPALAPVPLILANLPPPVKPMSPAAVVVERSEFLSFKIEEIPDASLPMLDLEEDSQF